MTERPYSDRMLDLAEKWRNGTISNAEKSEFIEWYNKYDDSELVWPGNENVKEELLGKIKFEIQEQHPVIAIKRNRIWKIVGSAAAVLLIIFLAVNYYRNNSLPEKKSMIVSSSQEAPAPGTDRAILILGNGKQIELKDQKIIEDGQIKIANNNKELIYTETSDLSYNTMITPRGGQYKLQLPDGSKVWLNAESKIIYPTAFLEKNRRVELEGEAYFEITKDKEKPFIVDTKTNGSVQVLGTRFNVNNYVDEIFKTTLLEGSVKVSNNLLQPGEAYTAGKVIHVDTAEVISWKNGYFSFNKTDIRAVMRQLKRWYDLDVVFEGEIPEKTFVGELPRNAQLDQILRVLSKTGLKFNMNGKTMIVTK